MTPIVFAADDNYALPLAVAIRSTVDNCPTPDSLSFTLLHQEMSDDMVDRVLKSCPEADIDVVRVPKEAYADLPTKDYLTTATYLRLLIPTLLAEHERVLYLDADSLVLGDVREVLDAPLRGHPLAAVTDPSAPRFDSPEGVRHWRELGMDPATPYLNAGLLLIDTKAWREMNIVEETIAYVRRFGTDILLDQEALNLVVRGNYQPVPLAWNIYPELAGTVIIARRLGRELPPEYLEAVATPKLVQFVGEDKPWTRQAMRAPFSKTFYHYVDRTAWAGWRPE
jgi:lipopolysaccharide biosynthesis glycosyltransferase